MASSASIASSRRSRSSGSGTLERISPKKPRTTSRRATSCGMPRLLQVEQLLVVEPAGGAGVPGAGDLAGLDLQVGHRSALACSVSTRLRLSSKVSVLSAAARVSTSPIHTVRARRWPCPWRVLVDDVGPAVQHRVVDQQPLLQVLPGIGVAQPGQLGVPAGAAVGHRRADPHQVPAQLHGDHPHGVAAERVVRGGRVHRVVGPLVGDHQPQLGAVAEHDLQVVGERAGAALRRSTVARCAVWCADVQVRGGGERPSPGPVTSIVTGSGARPSRVTTVASQERRPGRGGDPVCRGCRPRRGAGRRGRRSPRSTPAPSDTATRAVPSSAAVPSCNPRSLRIRGEPPVLLAAAGHLERGDVVGGERSLAEASGFDATAVAAGLIWAELIRRSPPSAAR